MQRITLTPARIGLMSS